jgi:hypothetical protein
MPRLIDYVDVERVMIGRGFVSLYPNSGAFGFPPEVHAMTVGWIGPGDSSIRPAARALARPVAAPYEPTLAALATRVWRELLPGPIWVQPKAHWAYELMFGSHEWMPALLRTAGVDPDILYPRHDGTAIEFTPGEEPAFEPLICGLLEKLLGSDFLITSPTHPIVCTVHHHKQLWWSTTDAGLLAALEGMVVKTEDGGWRMEDSERL